MNDRWTPYFYDLDQLRQMFPDGFPDIPNAVAIPGMPNATAPTPRVLRGSDLGGGRIINPVWDGRPGQVTNPVFDPSDPPDLVLTAASPQASSAPPSFAPASTPVPAISTFLPSMASRLRGPALRDPYEFGGVVTGIPVLGLDDDPEIARLVGPPPKPISAYAPAWTSGAQWTGGATTPAALPTPSPEPSPPNLMTEQQHVEAASRAAARRIRRGAVHSDIPEFVPPATDLVGEEGDPSLQERARLHAQDAYYRGTFAGAARLPVLQQYGALKDQEGIDPVTRQLRYDMDREARQAAVDLPRYDNMRPAQTLPEYAAALTGSVAGGLPTPESLVGLWAKGPTALWRVGKSAFQQGVTNLATDPIIQNLNIQSGVQNAYDWGRTALAPITGAVAGAGLKGVSEAVGRVVTSLRPTIRWDRSTRYEGENLPSSKVDPSEFSVIDVNPNDLNAAFQATNKLDYDGLSRMWRIIDHVNKGGSVSLPEVTAKNGVIDFENGRHRARLAAGLGHKSMPVAVKRHQEAEFLRLLKMYRHK